MSNSYHKNLVFTAACIGMCFFGVSMITLGAVLPSLIAKLNLSGLQTTSLATFPAAGHAGRFPDFRSHRRPVRT